MTILTGKPRVTTKRLQNFYDNAKESEISYGLKWYRNARQICRDIANTYGVDFDLVCQIMSTLSPSSRWERNIIDAENMIEAFVEGRDYDKVSVTTYGQNKQKAIRIMHGEETLQPTAKKTYAFYKNMADPDADFITIDRHAIKAALSAPRLSVNHNGSVTLGKPLYEATGAAYRRLARKLGMKGYQLQAIIWLVYKRLYSN